MVGQTSVSGRAASQIIVGDEASNGSKIGVLEIGGSSIVTNYGLSIGKTGIGAVYQRGGFSYWPVTGPDYNRSANTSGAYAYLGIAGGKFIYDADGAVDGDKKSSYFATIGSFVMASHGGFAEFAHSDKLGIVVKNGKFIYYQDGASTNCFDGEFGFGNGGDLNDNNYAGYASVTVSGCDSKLQVNSYLRFLWANPEASGYVNVNNGGVLAAKQLYRTSQSTPVYLNFNGGVLQPLSSDQEFTYKNEVHRFPSAVTVYENGCTIDTGAALNSDGGQLSTDDVIIRFPLQSPGEEGKRIASIALPSELASKKLVGSPIVKISGDGYGASAFALFNDLTREVTNIVVTSPGWGYTQASATLSGGGLTQAYACDVTLSNQPTEGWKGLTKRGIVALNMSGVNTFKGNVTVEEGLLSFNNSTAAQSGMPVGAGIILKNGARISFRGEVTSVSVPFIAGWGSTSYGRITVSDRIECAADDIFAGNHLRVGHDLVLTDGVKIVITDPENLYKYHRSGKAVVLEAGVTGENRKLTCNSTPELVFGKECATESVDRWKVRKSGNALTLDFMEGFVLSVR
jgi:autotransporter-associated beta strand protein